MCVSKRKHEDCCAAVVTIMVTEWTALSISGLCRFGVETMLLPPPLELQHCCTTITLGTLSAGTIAATHPDPTPETLEPTPERKIHGANYSWRPVGSYKRVLLHITMAKFRTKTQRSSADAVGT